MIKIEMLSKIYNKKVIYKNINLEFESNQTYALIGSSGSGKTTLLNALARLEKPTSGRVVIDGIDIWKMKEKSFFKKYLGYVFQNYALIDNKTVFQNLKLVNTNTDKISAALKKVGLSKDMLRSKIYELSGGQAQRVAIARMLLKEKRIILADEPTGALDEKTGNDIIDLLFSLVDENTYIIVATHDKNVYSRADNIIDVSKF
ncbi:MAG: ABC transporter ATP-binding protein [Leuconostoc pseudomesenteroides]|uniref:ABC transporter ATP-binding protein n=1 Tax=Lactobacillaceae TaxID=33958 RepID=UPI001E38FF12|nr:ABC transporter ATP-binding protein [Leuconostoc pseudomesenteroides]MCC7669109.1 peptide ABC transporter ATP-binding protein [Leuconostoc pseudomesenteroides]MCT4386633.1 ABC transporter ATP-binding protein [Leuconostoc pseudomesenteroides]